MASVSRCMWLQDRMSWTHRWAVMMPWINTRGDRVFLVFSCVALLQTEVSMGGRRDPKCPSARYLRIVREDIGACSEGATCAWMVADEAGGCTRAFLTMWWSSRRLVCRGRLEPGLRVNDIYRIHWSQHLLTTQSERPN
ncbi:uncharacterized protein TNCV_61711 [Trichonephila clavipes]|nr:uncharacterized protein TNCV_61711 [Trichonephila clavipes]